MCGRQQGGGISCGILLVVAVVLIHYELCIYVARIYRHGDSLVVTAQVLHVAILRNYAACLDVYRILVEQEPTLNRLSALQHCAR